MQVFLYNCSESTTHFINHNYINKTDITFTLIESLDVLMDPSKNSRKILLILEIKGIHIETLLRMKAFNFNIIILGLFNKSQMDLATSLINRKTVDYMDWLPLDSTDSIEEANTQACSSLEFISPWNYLNKNNELMDMLIMEYIYNLIYGEVSRMGTINEITHILSLRKIPNMVFILMIDDFWNICVNYDNRKRYAVKRSILKCVRRSISDYDAIACSLIGTDKIIILLDLSKYNGGAIQNIILERAFHIKEFIKNNTEYTATLGISNIHNDYRDIWRAYEEAFLAISYSFSLGKDLVVPYKDIEKSGKDGIVNYDFIHYEYQLFKNLLREDTKIILVFYDNLFNSLIHNRCKVETIKSIINKFVLNISQYSTDLGLDYNLISSITMEASSEIITASSVVSIKEIGKRYLETISKHILKFTKEDIRLSLDAAVLFIEKYYYNDITLNDVAHIANMSEGYFCRTFKKIYGVNFSNYILNLRLQKARELLLESNLSVSEISEKVGFNNLAYFSRSFKEKYSDAPSHYRNRM